jgi:hypothetical protein
MKILIDECLARALKRHLGITTARPYRRWSGKKNGELLTVATGEQFEVLVTIDQGMEHQQNLVVRDIALLVIKATSNQIEDLVPIMPAARAGLDNIQPGSVVRVP